jgi:hypothetical protein
MNTMPANQCTIRNIYLSKKLPYPDIQIKPSNRAESETIRQAPHADMIITTRGSMRALLIGFIQ